ncbi:MFS general substrate transporter-like protein [Staphylotrichum tortipilum]|uniref:MFS general substrate transporter-like protein n=1 Tax=Staphylotrichum tortipilum TaxID=2831512 RepID=A0AAN6RSN8_9PEZI|nr:MFS general substrate transporter-like protein [Staphylotrichum longicolle]
MVHTALVAASAAASNPTPHRPSLTQSRRSRPSGSFHAGEPFPLPPPFDESLPSSSRPRRRSVGADPPRTPRRQSTAKYHTFPTTPPAAPSSAGWSPRKPRAWYYKLFGRRQEPSAADDEARPAHLDGSPDSSAHHGGPDGEPDSPLHTGEEVGRRRKRRRRSVLSARHGGSRSELSTPLPWSQLGLLALLSLAEQTALNSIGPYLPTMVASFDEIPNGEEGVYVGLLASAFALAQLATNLLWGYLSDRVGRKPTMLLGTSLLTVCFLFFGFCTTYAQLIMVHVAMGLLNGNAAIVPTCLGEVTDRTNQSSAFTWLPVIYSLGSITGPALGGLLAGLAGGSKYPFLAPNILDAALLLASVVVLVVWFEETLDFSSANTASAGQLGLEWLKKAQRWCGVCWSGPSNASRGKARATSRHPLGTQGIQDARDEDSGLSDDDRQALISSPDMEEDDGKAAAGQEQGAALKQLGDRNTLAVLGTYLVFQLANISFNSLYPLFASSPPPTGRGLGPGAIGVSLSLAGLATMFFQLFVFQKLKAQLGNLGTYRCSLLGIALSMALMPWVGYLDNDSELWLGSERAWLYGELAVGLVLKNICAVGGLSCAMLLITNSAPSRETLGTLNGLAQTLSAAGRSVGPFLSGSLFTLSTRVRPKGEALAWGLFAGITVVGWLASFAIHSKGLESAEWSNQDDSDDTDGPGDEEEQIDT